MKTVKWHPIVLLAALLNTVPILRAQSQGEDDGSGQYEDYLGKMFESQERRRIKSPHEKMHRNTLAEFKPIVAEVHDSTVNILRKDMVVALGTVVGENGLILTKASQIEAGDEAPENSLEVQLPDRSNHPATLLRVFESDDLALLRIDTRGLRPVVWAPAADSPIGSIVVACGTRELPLSVGAVSLALRSLSDHRRGFLGVRMAKNEDGPGIVVGEVVEGSGAEAAGVQKNDLILSINDVVMNSVEDFMNAISQGEPGDSVFLEISRDAEKLVLEALLGDYESRTAGIPMEDRAPRVDPSQMLDMTARMGGGLSRRRSGFPLVIQHDLMLRPNQCGGPLVNLDGQAIGINIARAGRVRSYAIPSEVVRELLGDLSRVEERLKVWEMEDLEKHLTAINDDVEQAKQALAELEKERDSVLDRLETRRRELFPEEEKTNVETLKDSGEPEQ